MENQSLQPDAFRPVGAPQLGESEGANQPLSSSALPVADRPRESLYLQPSTARTTPPTALSRRRANKMQQECPQCGTMQSASTSVCMACGAFFPVTKSRTIRCRRCGTDASSNLHLCPGCGRELQAAPPRFIGWIAPFLFVVLFLLLIQQWNNLQPLRWTQTQLATGQLWITEMAERLDPQITISTIPAAVANNNLGQNVQRGSGADDSAQSESVQSESSSIEALVTVSSPVALAQLATNNTSASGESGTGDDESGDKDATVAPSLAVLAAAPTAAAIPLATATAAPSATASPTNPPTATAVPPTSSATAIAIQTVSQQVKATTQPTVIAPAATATKRATVQQRIAASAVGENSNSTSILQPTNTARPVPTATVSPTSSFTPTSPPTSPPTSVPTSVPATIYSIKSGDTPGAIAARYGIGVNELLAINGLGLDDARRLRVGQELIIPAVDQEPSSTLR